MTDSELNYCTVTVNYAIGLCGLQRSNVTGAIVSTDLYPSENTDGDTAWTYVLDATGKDYPISVQLPMCASSDKEDFIQIVGNSDNTTKISIMNDMVYRDNFMNFKDFDWIKKHRTKNNNISNIQHCPTIIIISKKHSPSSCTVTVTVRVSQLTVVV
jgi:hypothetical protein